jgi:hypothetical protein
MSDSSYETVYNYFKNFMNTIASYTYELPKNTYHKYCKNYYSSNGEDGLLEELIKELEITNGTCCEFGAWDGIIASNTLYLIDNYNFKAVLIESDRSRYNQLVKNYENKKNTHCYCAYVNNENLSNFLKEAAFPYNFDILSIDIDSTDYDIWHSFTTYEPKIVLIEVNHYRDPIVEELYQTTTTDYDNNQDLLFKLKVDTGINHIGSGASFIKMIELGLSKNYIPVAYTINIIFVHKDYIHKLVNIPYKISTDPYDYLYLYTNIYYTSEGWQTNSNRIVNTAIRNYYLQFKNKRIDYQWIVNEINNKKELIWNTEL